MSPLHIYKCTPCPSSGTFFKCEFNIARVEKKKKKGANIALPSAVVIVRQQLSAYEGSCIEEVGHI